MRAKNENYSPTASGFRSNFQSLIFNYNSMDLFEQVSEDIKKRNEGER